MKIRRTPTPTPVTPGLVRAVFGRAADETKVMQTHVQAMAEITGISVDDILGPSRRAPVVLARHVAIYLSCESGISRSGVGRFFDRDHTSVLGAYKKIAGMVAAATPDPSPKQPLSAPLSGQTTSAGT